jgi:hypothetical protein
MPKTKIPVTYRSTRPAKRGHPQPVTVSAERAGGSAQLCWLRIRDALAETVIYLDHATAHALWAQLGPIVRDQRAELAVLEAMAEDDLARGPL